jgi:Tfp pilus assembly protein FimT
MRLNGAAREVLGKLRWARSKAVEQNNSYIVTFPNNYSITILDDKNGNGTADAGEWTDTINLQTDYSNVTLSKAGGDPDPKFSSRGTAEGSTTITITNAGGSKTVNVTPTGNVKIN